MVGVTHLSHREVDYWESTADYIKAAIVKVKEEACHKLVIWESEISSQLDIDLAKIKEEVALKAEVSTS